MVRELILDYDLIALFSLLLLLFATKLVLMRQAKVRTSRLELLFSSLSVYDEHVIKNASHEELKRYYSMSNKLNVAFYVVAAFMLGVYGFMHMIE
jgi:hypothetical protein